MIRNSLEAALDKACGKIGLHASAYELSHPEMLAYGDYSSNIAFMLAKEAGKNPRALAEEIIAVLQKPAEVERVEIAGAGFINFFLTREFFVRSVADILAQGERWGSGAELAGRRVMVEYTQPNPFKPFHIGHLMSNTLGESLSRIIENGGAEVIRANYQGDVGLHVAKALWGMWMLNTSPEDIAGIGRAYAYGHEQYETSEEAKREIAGINKKVYAQDPEILDAYTRGREASLAHFEELYRALGTKFDHYFFESQTAPLGLALVAEGLEKGVFEKSDGAVIYRGEKAGLHTRVFLTSEGNPAYEAKELGLAVLKEKTAAFDESITTTAVEQAEYFKVVFAALGGLRPALAAKMKHVSHGMMQLTSGKMSSRKGNVITGESLLEDMKELALEKMRGRDFGGEERRAIAEAVAVAAIKYEILKQKAGKNIHFDTERSLSLEGDSGPYLLYAHTRAVSVLEKAREAHVAASAAHPPEATAPLERLLVRFPEVAERALAEYEPHHIITYLTELAAEFNSWYAKERILDDSPESSYKLALADAFRLSIAKGLWLLGVNQLRRM